MMKARIIIFRVLGAVLALFFVIVVPIIIADVGVNLHTIPLIFIGVLFVIYALAGNKGLEKISQSFRVKPEDD